LKSFQLLTIRSGILYTSTSLSGQEGFQLLKKAVDALLSTVDVSPTPSILWSVQYQQQASSGSEAVSTDTNEHLLRFPPQSLDLAFDDSTFDNVEEVWQKIMGADAGDFLVFQDREAYDDDDE
jgi:hypothetical protein